MGEKSTLESGPSFQIKVYLRKTFLSLSFFFDICKIKVGFVRL